MLHNPFSAITWKKVVVCFSWHQLEIIFNSVTIITMMSAGNGILLDYVYILASMLLKNDQFLKRQCHEIENGYNGF